MKKLEYIPGDLCIVKGKVESVCEVDRDNDFSITTDQHPFIRLSEVKPIPLTPEILEKNGWKIEDVNPHDLSNIVSKGIIYRAIKGKEILFFQKGASVFTCPLNWRKIEIRYVHELQHLLFGLKLNSEMEI